MTCPASSWSRKNWWRKDPGGQAGGPGGSMRFGKRGAQVHTARGLRLNGEKVNDINLEMDRDSLAGVVLQKGKRVFGARGGWTGQ